MIAKQDELQWATMYIKNYHNISDTGLYSSSKYFCNLKVLSIEVGNFSYTNFHILTVYIL